MRHTLANGWSMRLWSWLAGLSALSMAENVFCQEPGIAAQAARVTVGGTLRGTVVGGAGPLQGSLVSDGCRVVRTDSRGAYELPLGRDSGRFVFVTCPRGFWTDKFFVPLETATRIRRADFVLHPMDQPDRFDFVFITDMHIDDRRWGIPKFRASLREIGSLKPVPAFLWAQGDICLQGGAGAEYLECLGLLKIPVRNGAGNHEMLLEHENPRDEFERLFGPTYYSFDWGAVHCIVLDGNKPVPRQKGWKAVHGTIEGSELAWLQVDLAAQPEGKAIVVGVHIPIISTYPERRRQSPQDAPYWEITNNGVLTELFSRYHVRCVFQGHMHENERITIQGVEYVESISLSGSWYRSGPGFERGVDGTPRGYRVVSVDGTRISHRYRSSGESYVNRRGEFAGLPSPLRARPNTEFVFNCYDAPNGSTARARIDRGDWLPMPAFAAMNKSEDLAMPHHFRLVADLTHLQPGSHTLEVRVRWPDKSEVSEKEIFQVLPSQ